MSCPHPGGSCERAACVDTGLTWEGQAGTVVCTSDSGVAEVPRGKEEAGTTPAWAASHHPSLRQTVGTESTAPSRPARTRSPPARPSTFPPAQGASRVRQSKHRDVKCSPLGRPARPLLQARGRRVPAADCYSPPTSAASLCARLPTFDPPPCRSFLPRIRRLVTQTCLNGQDRQNHIRNAQRPQGWARATLGARMATRSQDTGRPSDKGRLCRLGLAQTSPLPLKPHGEIISER